MRRIVLTVVVVASMIGILMGTMRGPLVVAGDRLWTLGWLAWPAVGWIILVRRPQNRIGRVCVAIGVAQGLAFSLQSIVLDVSRTAAAWVELTYTVVGIIPWLAILWLLVVFPTGAYAGRLERFIGRAVIALGVWAVLGFLISPAPLSDTGLANPLARPSLSGLAVIAGESGFLLVVALGLAAIFGLVTRRRRSTGIERQQYRWLLLGASVFVLIAAAGQVLPENTWGNLVWLVGGSAIPVSIGVAVVRYRLFEIDRIISRSVGYVLVVGLLGTVFFGTVTLLTSVLPADSQLAVAGSTLVVAALFNPLRKRVQNWVDRRFNRSRYDAPAGDRRVRRFVAGGDRRRGTGGRLGRGRLRDHGAAIGGSVGQGDLIRRSSSGAGARNALGTVPG